MTTIPGHNVVVQQSGVVHEATQHVRPNRPDPEQLAAQQAARVIQEKTIVPDSTDSQRIGADREKQEQPKGRSTKNRLKKKIKGKQETDTSGNLLDTVA